jgi:hypothetical protein
MPAFPTTFIDDPVTYLGAKPLLLSIGSPAGTLQTPVTVQFTTGQNVTLPLLRHDGPAAMKQLGWMGADAPPPGSASITQDYPIESCYVLNWAADKVYYTTLGAAGRVFVTVRLNGCGVIIGGDVNSPVVVHANISPASVFPERVGVNDENIQREEKGLAWGRYYAKLAVQLRNQGIFANDRITVIHPEFYQMLGSFARVFGVRRMDGWSFYANMDAGGSRASTKKIWPQ